MYWRAYAALNAIRRQLLNDEQQSDNTFVDEYYMGFYHLKVIKKMLDLYPLTP